MSRFTDALVVSPLADGTTWVVVRDFGYELDPPGSGARIDVAIGFQTDFASVPRLLWVVLPKWGTYGNASVIHDWLYWTQTTTRAAADRIFDEAMGVLGVRPLVRRAMYSAVRLFGGLAWLRNQEDRAQGFDRVSPAVRLKAVTRSQRRRAIVQLGHATWRRLRGAGSQAPSR